MTETSNSCSATDVPLDAFRARVEKFLRDTGMAESRFGLEACNDRAFVGSLRKGREPRWATMQKVDKFITERLAREPARQVG